jgi:hypothetical protein
MRTEILKKVEATLAHDQRKCVQCECGYEWKVASFVEGVDLEKCLVCGSITVHSKSIIRNSSSRLA